MKGLALYLLVVLGLACSPPKPAPVVTREYILVPAPEPSIPPRPALPSKRLSVEASIQDLVRALLADREALAAWALDLETRLSAYLNKGDNNHDGTIQKGKR